MSYKKEGKPDYTLLHRDGLDDLVRALEYGANKHGRDNYLSNPNVTDSELVAAALRHLLAATDDPGALDDESGLPHVVHAAANVYMISRRRTQSPAPLEPCRRCGGYISVAHWPCSVINPKDT